MSSLTTNSLPGSERGSGDDEGMIQVHCSAKMQKVECAQLPSFIVIFWGFHGISMAVRELIRSETVFEWPRVALDFRSFTLWVI
jgi:hypothetical protein